MNTSTEKGSTTGVSVVLGTVMVMGLKHPASTKARIPAAKKPSGFALFIHNSLKQERDSSVFSSTSSIGDELTLYYNIAHKIKKQRISKEIMEEASGKTQRDGGPGSRRGFSTL
jgi:hypothetical protein